MSDRAIQLPAGLTTDGLLGKRYMARVIDWIIVSFIVIAVFKSASGLRAQIVAGGSGVVVQLSISLIVWIAYGAVFESSTWQATVGKRVMGIRVYGEQGHRLTLLRAA